MYRELGDLPKRVVLDTNVLLDATFVMDGHARRATSLLRSLDLSPVIDLMIEQEAEKILRDKTGKLGLTFDAQQTLDGFISELPIIRLPPAPVLPLPGINDDDRHVVRAACHYDAWVLTGDASLTAECEDIGILARSPWDVLMEHASRSGEELSVEQIIRPTPPKRESGFIFGRVIPGAWAGRRSADKHTVCHLENVGRVLYDTDTEEWVFEMPIGVSARVKCPLVDNETWAVCGSYHLPGAGRQGRVTIQAGKCPSTVCRGSNSTLKRITSPSAGQMNCGSSIQGNDAWSGHFRALVIGPQGMSKKKWRAIVRVPEGVPNPYDADALEGVLRAKQAMLDSGHGLLLTEEQLRQWLVASGWHGQTR